MLTVYLSNKYIRAVEGEVNGKKLRIRQMYLQEDTTGSILNGTIVDEEALTEQIKILWDRFHLPKKDVHLILDSSQFTARTMQIPLMSTKKTMDYLQREFTGVERITEPVYGYFPVKAPDRKAKLQTVSAIAAPREYILKYTQLFDRLNIDLHGVESVQGAFHRLIQLMDTTRDHASIIQIVDDMNLINVLWMNGNMETTNRKRMFADPGTVAYSVEMSRAANNLLQFAKAQNMETPITHIYVAGVSREDLEIYQNTMTNINSELQVSYLPSGENLIFQSPATAEGVPLTAAYTDYVLVMGGLLEVASMTSMMNQLRYSREELLEREKKKRLLIPGVIALLALLGTAAGMFVRQMRLQGQLDELVAYNTDPQIVQMCEEYETMYADMQRKAGFGNTLTLLEETLHAYPKVSSKTKEKLLECAQGQVSVDLLGYDSGSGQLEMDFYASDVALINHFVDRLMAQGMLTDVVYTGYAQEDGGIWKVNVQCRMAPEEEAES